MHEPARSDVLIVGAGPLGIELAVALRRVSIDPLHIEAGQVGQTVLWWPPQTRWFSSPERIEIAGVPLQTDAQEKCTREAYLAYLRSVVLQFDLPIRTGERVTELRREPEGFRLDTIGRNGRHSVYEARYVILATGGTARPFRLDIPGEDLPHVTHTLEDPHAMFRRRVVVVGGRNSAVEAALRLYRVAADVRIVYRGAGFPDGVKYWLRPEIEHLIKTGCIDARFNAVPTKITPHAVTCVGVDDGVSFDIPADDVLLMVGYVADMSLFEQVGVPLRGDRLVPEFQEQTMETPVPGLFVAGTATAGTQRSGVRVFLENCHVHVDRIVAALTGAPPPPPPEPLGLPEA